MVIVLVVVLLLGFVLDLISIVLIVVPLAIPTDQDIRQAIDRKQKIPARTFACRASTTTAVTRTICARRQTGSSASPMILLREYRPSMA